MGKACTIFSFVWEQRDAVQKGWRGPQAPGPQRPAQLSNMDSAAQQQREAESEAGSQSLKTKQPRDRFQFPKSGTSALDKYKFQAVFENQVAVSTAFTHLEQKEGCFHTH